LKGGLDVLVHSVTLSGGAARFAGIRPNGFDFLSLLTNLRVPFAIILR